ncbi:MAG: ornithine carbamoyltransferase [Planctomycetota bacterium]|jgi:ornithine carbamoyltransferase
MTDFGKLPHKDLISIAKLSSDEVRQIFATAAELKAKRNELNDLMAGKKLAMIFEKDSLRTRFTFDIGMQDMGGHAVFLDHRDARIGSREAVRDVARNLERWVDLVVARTFKHRAVVELAENCSIPVINGLTDFLHPCQALSDFFTLTEKWGDVQGKRLTYIGDGNNTCHSLIYAAAKLGANITVCTPEGYEPNAKVINQAMIAAQDTGSEVRIMNEPREACEGANAIYTDVWASMGQEDEVEERAGIFREYQVDEELMALTDKGLFMHCLPAHRGHEVTSGVMDGESSIVFDIAENRLHVQKAIMLLLVEGQGS